MVELETLALMRLLERLRRAAAAAAETATIPAQERVDR
jgi:hypothetical protein